MTVLLPGYLEGFHPPPDENPLKDRMDLLADPSFWPVFLSSLLGAEAAVDAFDGDPADMDELVSELLDPSAWPVLTVRVRAGRSIHIVFRNYEDDGGVDYLLSPADDGPLLDLVALEGHFRGPGLSWSELVAAAGMPDPDLTAAQRLLLLLPASGDVDRPFDATSVIAEALTSVGAARQQQELAATLLNCPHYWTPARWRVTDGVRWCEGGHTTRPQGDPNLRAFTEAFG